MFRTDFLGYRVENCSFLIGVFSTSHPPPTPVPHPPTHMGSHLRLNITVTTTLINVCEQTLTALFKSLINEIPLQLKSKSKPSKLGSYGVLGKLLVCCISNMVGYARTASGVVILSGTKLINIRTVRSFPPKNVILTLHITMTLVILLPGFSLTVVVSVATDLPETMYKHVTYIRTGFETTALPQTIAPTKFLFLETTNLFHYHPDICLNIDLKCFVFL